MAIVGVVALIATAASASAQFTPLSEFSGSFNCPGPVAFDPGGGGRSAAVYVGDPCIDPTKGDSSNLDAYLPSGSGPDGTFNLGNPSQWTYEETTECLEDAAGAAIDPATGDVYVSDAAAAGLIDFSDAGVDLNQLGAPTSCGDSYAGSGLTEPQGLAVYDGDLYVAGGGTVLRTPLGLSGSTTAFPLNPSNANPIALAIDPSNGDMFVVDGTRHEVYEYNASGSYIGVFATGFGPSTFSDPTAIAVDGVAQVIYVADAGTGDVDTFAEGSGGSLLQTPIISGEYPYGVALDTTNHVLYVADEQASPTDNGLGSVQRFSYTPAPSCSAASATTKGGVAVSLSLSCSDQAGATVTDAIATNPADGTISNFNPATGALTYTPNGGFDGTDSFTYRASSVDGTSAPATATVTVSGPTCAPETLLTPYQQALTITLACSDSSSAVTSYKVISSTTDGTLTAPSATGTLTYTPRNILVGVDSFTYEATAANGETSAPQTITIYLGTSLPAPVEDQSANLYFAYGAVTVLLPGQTTPIPLTGGLQAPLGSIVNATNGGAGVFVEDNGQEQGANFWNGEYKLTQSGDPQTTIYLLGRKIPKVRCALHPHSFSDQFTLGQAQQLGSRRLMLLTRSIAAKKFHEKGKATRQLWGSGHGDFTTVGNGSSASVRGTEWAIFDYPDGTLTFDYTDSVSVYDFHRHKHVKITAGHYYFAALGNLPPCGKTGRY